MTSQTVVARVKALQHRTPFPALRVLKRLHIGQADVAFVAERSQGQVSKMLNGRVPFDDAVVEAVRALVPAQVASDCELWGDDG